MAEEDVIKREEAELQVRQMGKMMAALFYHMAREILSELGEERGTELVGRAIKAYGSERGEGHKERALAAGIEHRKIMQSWATFPAWAGMWRRQCRRKIRPTSKLLTVL